MTSKRIRVLEERQFAGMSKIESESLRRRALSRPIREKTIHMHIWQWVQKNRPELVIFHVPNGEPRDVATATKLKRMGVVPGCPDFLFFTATGSYAIELKAPGGHLSPKQEEFQRRWTALGPRYHYFVCRSFFDFEKYLEKIEI